MAARLLVLTAALGVVECLEIRPVVPQGDDPEGPARQDELRKLGAEEPGHKRIHYGACSTRSEEARLTDCRICKLASEDGPEALPTLYAWERSDGCGARLHDIIMWAAVAARNRMKFGGVIARRGVCKESHGVNIFRSVSAVLGLSMPEDMFSASPPPIDREYRGVNDFHRKFVDGSEKKEDYVPGGNVLVADASIAIALDRMNQDFVSSEFLTSRFMHALRSSSTLHTGTRSMWKTQWTTTQQELGKNNFIAMHVRRGDVTADNNKGEAYNRITSDRWYFAVVKQIRDILPDADVHVFSSTENKYSVADFDAFRQRRMEVHLDGDILDAWAALSAAKVLVMAKSSFSHVPAFLNPNCVIYQPYWHPPLRDWIVSRGDDAASTDFTVGRDDSEGQPRFINEEDLRSCLARNRAQ